MSVAAPPSYERTVALRRRASLLAWLTIVYNTAEGVVAVAAGAVAGSVALVSFGLDSAVEVMSAGVVAWQFSGGGARAAERERRSLLLIGVAFLALAAFVAVESVRALLSGADPDSTPVGIGIAAASLVVMPLLTWAKRRTGRQLGSAAVLADSTQTLLCTYLSAALLAGLLLDATLGWAWADAAAGLVIAAVALKEGVGALRGDACCGPVPAAVTVRGAESPCGCSDDRQACCS